MKVVRTRILLLVVAALTALGLTACDTKTGAAAYVDGTRISESEVSKYIVGAGSDSDPRRLVLTFLLKDEFYRRVMARSGKAVPTAAALSQLQTSAAGTILGATVSAGAAGVKQFDTLLAAEGVSTTFTPVLLHSIELEYQAGVELTVSSVDELRAKVKALGIPVKVSPRYGSWEASASELSDTDLRDFITVAPTAQATTG